jgi:endonuclease/exonuclease/phosphatase family metal-dependent hydrolase
MKRALCFFLFLCINLYALDFKVASYNVENLFDLNYDGTEYKEYIPNTKYWHKKAFKNKLNNISRVINDLDADILSLQEIESQAAFEKLKSKTKYKYGVFLKKKTSSVGVAVLSTFPLVKYEGIDVDRYDKYSRHILKAFFNINGKDLVIYVNHWRSKRAAESTRIKYALALKKDIQTLKKGMDYIILGDLNSNYDEFLTFKYDDKLNDTYGITGINQILNTTFDGNLISKEDINTKQDDIHYNLWLEIKKQHRFSSIFRSENITPDNIIVSKELFDTEAISYVNNSFNVFKPPYLYGKYLNRWDMRKAKGYSDHLPVFAYFSTDKQNYTLKKSSIKKITKISDLYKVEKLSKSVELKNAVVLYKAGKIAVIKQPLDRAVAVYNPPKELEAGRVYNLVFDKLDSYFGLKEIKNITSFKETGLYKNYKQLYKNGLQTDLFNLENQNEMIKNLSGVYKKGYLYTGKNKKIKLYFKKGIKKPEDKENIFISSGHLGIYRSKIQIILYKQSDFGLTTRQIL